MLTVTGNDLYQGLPDLFVCGPNFKTNFYLGPHILSNMITYLRSRIFWPFLCHFRCLFYINLDTDWFYATLFQITKRFKGRKNKLEGRTLATSDLYDQLHEQLFWSDLFIIFCLLQSSLYIPISKFANLFLYYSYNSAPR